MSNEVSIAEIVVGEARISFEIPSSLYNIISEHAKADDLKLYSYNAEQIIDILRSFVPEDKKPPTHRQESYAKSIAKALNLDLPDEVLNSSESCSEFLDTYSEQYQEQRAKIAEFRSRNKALISTANKVGRWQSAKLLLEQGTPIEKVAEQFGVKPPTIEKYVMQFNEWSFVASSNGTYDIVQNLIKRQSAGEDIYALYDENLG
ncbi:MULTISPECIES: hypothetical protein [Vibrio]|uniref:hypothetical protein n=1 Tax=Vibrio TaxID=662 RepID=UPI000D65AF59|nr:MULTISPECIES: hypothetical protein [Vibrio]ELA7337552.1 hypothetical protein [Vibrio parahaemolyticus]NAW53888.1 hypothetical protein [Vibrio sp. V41_P2S12T139]NAW95828.1 hypothetical protein [Vibrio sp. V42_P2S4T144]MCR9306500.1 hypothetical protein [Vibrio diabolicus]MCS0046804.1 hypothetical protein [Vibrio antiquarius]